jgi:hypothetical protein
MGEINEEPKRKNKITKLHFACWREALLNPYFKLVLSTLC